MWIAKFKNFHKTCIIAPLCKKHNVIDYVYLLNSWAKGNKFYYTELHFLEGEEKNKNKFINDFRKISKTLKCEVKGSQIFTFNYLTSKNLKKFFAVFNPELIYVKPVVQRADGYEDWELACWDKKPLMEIMKIPDFDMKLISIEWKKGFDIFLPRIQSKIPEKQKQAMNLAIKNGYYNYPRKINLDELARITKVSKQTFQENLRKAENKIIPYLV
ncbi:MAG: helix-turn-helix domain-containing protein [Candidatus Pacearchaeota archaeon]|jgi:predicted DNA binding protein